MPITADILKRLVQPQPRPQDILNLDPPQQSPFLKVPNSALLSKITRGNPEPIAPSAPSVNPNLEMRPNHDPNSGLALPSPQPDTSALEPLGVAPPTRVGQSTAGMNPSQRQQTLIDVLKNSSPRSKITQEPDFIAEGAPRAKGGFKERLLKALEGGVIGMGQIANQNARSGREQTLESLLGGGAAGAATGGISPITIDALKRQSQIGQAEGELERQQGLEKQRADVIGAQQRPLIEAARIQMEQQKAEDAARRADETNQIRREANDIQRNRPTAQKQPIFKTKKKSDGSEVTLRSDDNGATFKEVPELGSEAPPAKPAKESGLTPYQQTERKAKAAALVGKIDGARRDAENALKQAENLPDTDPNKATHIANYRQALADGNAAATELGQAYGDLYEAGPGTADESGKTSQGVQWPYYKPIAQTKGTRRAGGVQAAPTTHGFSVSAWLLKNPGKTEADARAFHDAKYAGYQIVP